MPHPIQTFAYKAQLEVSAFSMFIFLHALTAGLGGDAGGAGSEDCLKVNIYAHAGAKSGDKCADSSHKLQP